MDKRLIIGIIVLILIVLAGGIFVVVNMNNKIQDNTEKSEQEVANSNVNINNKQENQNKQNTNTNTSKKTLVIYYSRSGNTKQIADYISEKTGGDVVRIETVRTYPSNYDEMLDTAKEEQRNGGRPELKNKNINIKDYDTIFLGYPIWWGKIATPVYTFLDNYDLSGKKIAPFVTSGSSGLSGTPSDIKREEPNAEVLEAMSITSSTLSNYKSLTDNWLSKLGF
ncbi:MAG: flavodoxin [Clostridia bacterium]|nr:flavodoxin [Clostridia bacterium]